VSEPLHFVFGVHDPQPVGDFDLRRAGELAASGRAELLTGGFYEPILPLDVVLRARAPRRRDFA